MLSSQSPRQVRYSLLDGYLTPVVDVHPALAGLPTQSAAIEREPSVSCRVLPVLQVTKVFYAGFFGVFAEVEVERANRKDRLIVAEAEQGTAMA